MYNARDLIFKQFYTNELAKQLAHKALIKLIMLYPSDRQVLKQIAFRENGRDGFCWERKKNIAWRNKLSRQTVHKSYKRLQNANLITISYKTINNKIFICANTKELGWFIGNFLLYCLRNNLKSFYYAPKYYFKELFNIIYNFIKNNLSNILSGVKGYVKTQGERASFEGEKSGFYIKKESEMGTNAKNQFINKGESENFK